MVHTRRYFSVSTPLSPSYPVFSYHFTENHSFNVFIILPFKMFTWIWTRLINLLLYLYPGQAYSPPSSVSHLSETVSPIYPDRPIRPLPKRRLRSRLSPEVANSILYPIAPHAAKPLFYLPFNETTSYTDGSPTDGNEKGRSHQAGHTGGVHGRDKKNGYQFKGNDLDSDEEDSVGIIRRYQEQRHAMSTASRNFTNGLARSEFPKHMKPSVAQSTASSIESVDGYDSFENTNNKKKRKIPTSGNLGNHHSTLSAEMAHMGISSNRDMEALQVDPDAGVGQYYGTGSSAIPATTSGTGISGAGRGRYGRVGTRNTSGRSPLGVSVNGSNALQNGRAVLQRRDYTPSAKLSGKGNQSFTRLLKQSLISSQTLHHRIKASYLQPLQTQRLCKLTYPKDRRTLVYSSSNRLRNLHLLKPNLRSPANRTLQKV